MDRKQMRRQAQIIRNKRLASPQRRATPITQQGFLHVNRPLPRKPQNVYAGPPTPSQLRKARAAKALEQRQALEAERQKQTEQFTAMGNPPSPPPPPPPPQQQRKGCGGCRRKR